MIKQSGENMKGNILYNPNYYNPADHIYEQKDNPYYRNQITNGIKQNDDYNPLIRYIQDDNDRKHLLIKIQLKI